MNNAKLPVEAPPKSPLVEVFWHYYFVCELEDVPEGGSNSTFQTLIDYFSGKKAADLEVAQMFYSQRLNWIRCAAYLVLVHHVKKFGLKEWVNSAISYMDSKTQEQISPLKNQNKQELWLMERLWFITNDMYAGLRRMPLSRLEKTLHDNDDVLFHLLGNKTNTWKFRADITTLGVTIFSLLPMLQDPFDIHSWLVTLGLATTRGLLHMSKPRHTWAQSSSPLFFHHEARNHAEQAKLLIFYELLQKIRISAKEI